ncbi:MAG TPA: helix-turn-helix transcriptional regulator [Firmicutes bacterium]|nr:helix-turn-helix transcriptional regulator [Bacillota bacterium]
MESMGERLRRARLSRGLSLNDVAVAVQVHYSTISAYERGTRHPSYSVLSRLAQLYQIPIPFLVCRREDLAGVLPAEMRQFFEIANERRDVARMAVRAAQFDHEVIYHLDGLLSLLENSHSGTFGNTLGGTFSNTLGCSCREAGEQREGEG